MGGIAFQSPTSCRLLSGRLRRYSAFPGRIYAPTVQFLEASLWNTPLKSKKPPDWVVFCFLEMGGIATTLRSPPGSSFRAGVLTSAALLGRSSSLRSAFEPVQFPPSLDKKVRPPFGVALLFLEMGGIALRSGPPALSLQAALDGLRRPPWRLIFAFAQRHLTINSPHLSIKK